ncbi:histone deacetylase family protein [Deferrisoma sp.]
MHIVWSERFLEEYTGDPAARAGRLEPTVGALEGFGEWVEPSPAPEEAVLRCHTADHLDWVRRCGVWEIAALAAGGAIEAARLARKAPAFALVRPPGHHASRHRAWGFCYLNNLAIALADRRASGDLERALVLDIDLHFGDGTVNILGSEPWVAIGNPEGMTRDEFLRQVANALAGFEGDWIAVSAGFDRHARDWGGLLETEDYGAIGRMVGLRARALGASCFAVLEGGYNPAAMAEAARRFCEGIEAGWAGLTPARTP